MIDAVRQYLVRRGYKINDRAHQIIREADRWYKAEITDAHKRVTVQGQQYTLARMAFGRRMAADDANLCEVVEINAGGENELQHDFVRDVLADNRFDTQYRKQLELTAAEGTTACYVWLDGAEVDDSGAIVRNGRIRLNYADALGYIPLTVENGDVLEAAFWGKDYTNTEKHTTLVVFTRDADGVYTQTVRVYDEDGKEVVQRGQEAVLGTVKPFAVMQTAQANTFDDMQGFGYPKMHNVIPVLLALDAAFTAFAGDIDTAEKIVLINEALCKFDEHGKPITPNEQMKRRFVMLGEKLPDQKDLVHEIVPEIRVESFRTAIETLLSMLTLQFGYGSKKYTIDQTGAVTTATQYVGERQDMLMELNRQRYEAKQYITEIVRAILWYSNAFHGTAWDIDAEVRVEFDDSYITNKADQLAEMRNDILSGIGGAYVRKQYLMLKYNLTEEEAAKWAAADDPDALAEPGD